jgi:hypothetical protein
MEQLRFEFLVINLWTCERPMYRLLLMYCIVCCCRCIVCRLIVCDSNYQTASQLRLNAHVTSGVDRETGKDLTLK